LGSRTNTGVNNGKKNMAITLILHPFFGLVKNARDQDAAGNSKNELQQDITWRS